MNDNEFFNPENNTNEETPVQENSPSFTFGESAAGTVSEETHFEPLKEVPVQDFSQQPEEILNPEQYSPSIEEPGVPFSSEDPQEAPFNPYAPKNEPTAPVSSDYVENNANSNASAFNSQVNPSYTRPFTANQNQGFNNSDNSFNGNYNQNNYGYNNQSYYPPYQQPPKPKDNKNGKLIATAIVAVCVIVGVIALVSSLLGGGNDIQTETTAPILQSQDNGVTTTQGAVIATTQPVQQVSNSIWVAEKVRPVVVGVLAYQQGELAGEGSGVLLSEDLAKNCTYIVTCAHVINEPGCDFSVLLLDGTRYDAEVVALDERTDIGVLKIAQTGMNLAELGDSSSLKFGETVYAIGNPGGSEFFGSITDGIVSSIDRSISATYTMTCIQHNAAINPGNSGGALVNTAGQVIGINSSKIAKTDYEGMGFAVPSAIFKPVVDALIQYGYVPNRPELGIKYAAVSSYQLYSIIVSIKGLPKESIIIAEIPEGSALSGTQAQVGDLIIAVNGQNMESSNVLLDMIDTGAVGDTLTLTLCRVQSRSYEVSTFDVTVQLVEDKGSITTTTQPATLPQQDPYGDFSNFFDFFGW